jgi:hypothetical protein|tara:strand:+ start:896 stop:1144 length:249 start_codon:yes stop_codon:yes gene_type:complete
MANNMEISDCVIVEFLLMTDTELNQQQLRNIVGGAKRACTMKKITLPFRRKRKYYQRMINKYGTKILANVDIETLKQLNLKF